MSALASVSAQLREAAASAPDGGGTWRAVEVRGCPPLTEVLRATEGDAHLFIEPGGRALLGLGGWRLSHAGSDRFSGVRDAIAARALPAGPTMPWLVSFAFAATDPGATSARWQGFAAAELWLPAVLLTQVGDTTRAWVRRDAAEALGPLFGARCGGAGASGVRVSRAALEGAFWRSGAEFSERLGALLDRLRSEDIPKIVAARRVDIPFILGDIAAIIDELDVGSYRFVVRHDNRTFFGASPELLARVSGGAVETVALAGTSTLDPDAVAALIASPKEDDEHRLVVQHLTRALGALGVTPQLPDRPALRRLAYVAHLESRVTGALPPSLGALDVAGALHPTPAVCGTPTEVARAWIEEEEGADRGLYAGVVGWVDGRGDGVLAVAIRSALASPDTLSLYVGAGIVRGSNPGDERRETEQKLAGLRAVLGLT